MNPPKEQALISALGINSKIILWHPIYMLVRPGNMFSWQVLFLDGYLYFFKMFCGTVNELIYLKNSEFHKLFSIFPKAWEFHKNRNCILLTVNITKSFFQILENTRISKLNLATWCTKEMFIYSDMTLGWT